MPLEIFLSAVSLLWMLSDVWKIRIWIRVCRKLYKGSGGFPDSMEGEAYASSITLKGSNNEENGLPVKECGVCWVPKQERSRLRTCVTSDI